MKTVHQILTLCLSAVLILGSISCTSNKSEQTQPVSLKSLSGTVQKGPYLVGTLITISELDRHLNPTGKNYYTQITSNSGSFATGEIDLKSQYVELLANGFYFNEVTGENSTSQLPLFALSDISDKTSVNVNLLTTLEKDRVEYLMNEGKSFAEAKSQAEHEILRIFFLDKSDIPPSELLDISKPGDNNAILLALSAILQSNKSEADLSELLATISEDIRTDGKLDNSTVKTRIINDALLIDTSQVRIHLTDKYANLSDTFSIPSFAGMVQRFIDSTDFQIVNEFSYPLNGVYAPNILSLTRDTFWNPYPGSWIGAAMTAFVPKGNVLKVGFYPDLITYPAQDTILSYQSYSEWFFEVESNPKWDYTDLTPNYSREFTSNVSGQTIEMKFHLNLHGSAQLKIFENDMITPKRIKKIYW